LVPSTTGTGLGDFNPTFFLSPAKPGEFIWSFGPTFTLPTATDRNLGAGKWSVGPAGVALTIHGPWVYGALINNQWYVGGWGDRAVNLMLLQWFLNYDLPNGSLEEAIGRLRTGRAGFKFYEAGADCVFR